MNEVKYVRRGEIYSVRMDNGLGSEQGVSRPALVISNDVGNNAAPTVVVAYLTTRDHNIGIHYGPTKATGRPSYVQCEQLATVDKRRLVYLMGSLSKTEMKEVEDRLDEVLELGYVDDTPLKEKEAEIAELRFRQKELFDKITNLEAKIAAHADELVTRDVEIAIAKRMYEKAVGIIAAMRAESDLPERPNGPPKPPKVDEVKIGEPPKKPEKPKVEPKLVDINTASFTQLRGIGLTNNVVLGVINGRPYKSVEDVKKVPGMSAKLFGIVGKRICCVPVEEPKQEPKRIVSAILEPDPDYEAEESEITAAPVKVNVNTASAQEIHDVTGLSMNACFAITGKRKSAGRFASLDELVIPNRLSAKILEKHRDKMEV